MDSDIQKHSAVTRRIAAVSIMTAVTVVFTYIVRIPIAPTRGYINLGDVAVYFTAFTFGPVTALIAGGLGTAVADLIAGYAQWAPITLVIHGLQGFVAGLLMRRVWRDSHGNEGLSSEMTARGRVMVPLAGICGTAVMVVLYFLAGALMAGPGAAAVEIPGNLIQNAVGVLGGAVLTKAVQKGYPPVREFCW